MPTPAIRWSIFSASARSSTRSPPWSGATSTPSSSTRSARTGTSRSGQLPLWIERGWRRHRRARPTRHDDLGRRSDSRRARRHPDARSRHRPARRADQQPRSLTDGHGSDLIGAWDGPVIVVSHDLELLERMQNTAELRAGSLMLYGGPYSEFREQVAREQAAAERALRSAEHTRSASRCCSGSRRPSVSRTANGKARRMPPIASTAVVNDRRNSAEKTHGRQRGLLDDRMQAAQRSPQDAESRIRDDDRVSIDLPTPPYLRASGSPSSRGATGERSSSRDRNAS